MDLRTSIRKDLWETIEKNYENESYSSAILDTMYLLTDTIRNKTGLEGDGSSLIGQAFGGENPKLQLSKLQTDSEKNIQKGMQEILRGLYTAVRNPRSHDKYPDTKDEADAIIYFVDYLLKIIDKSKVSFVEEIFLNRVFEKHYVKTSEYSDLLVKEIPKRQRANIATTVILKREEGEVYNIGYFMTALLGRLEEHEMLQVYKTISEELKYASLDKGVSTILHIFKYYWNENIEKVVKIRIENMLFEDVKSGKCASDGQCSSGAIGTWLDAEHIKNFENPLDWTRMLVKKMKRENEEEIMYIETYFFNALCKLNFEEIHYTLKDYFSYGLKHKDLKIVGQLESQLMFEGDHPWWKVFEEELKVYPEIEPFTF